MNTIKLLSILSVITLIGCDAASSETPTQRNVARRAKEVEQKQLTSLSTNSPMDNTKLSYIKNTLYTVRELTYQDHTYIIFEKGGIIHSESCSNTTHAATLEKQ